MGDINTFLIRSGISVQIRRTDGRTHPAIVSNVNSAMQTVTVEWFERGETKGKEIDFATIYALNANLHPTSNINNQSLDTTSNIERHTSRASIGPLTSKIKGNSIKGTPNLGNSNGFGSQPSSASSRVVEDMPPPNLQTTTQVPRMSHPLATTDAVSRRRGNVVKEVEKLKKNREERRQKQAEKKEEKEALMNIDPGNPRWEFLAMIREYQAALDIRPLKESDIVECHQITVCVRKRPLNKKEISKKEIDVITVPRKDSIIVHEPKNKVDLTKYLENQQFRFDYAFNEHCSNELVYKFTAKPLVNTLFEGGMATCFAYGQTGSGKTHTMGGIFFGKTQDCKKGIYAMVAKDVFHLLHSPQYKSQKLTVSASFFEIYTGKVFDLLADKAKLRVLEDGKQQVQIVGLTEKIVNSVEEVLALIQAGNTSRTSGQTSANSNSSRSHAVFQITLRTAGLQKIFGKFSLIDLAGNERGADTSSANRVTRMEGAEINKSLLALKECIRALGRKGAHLPFRASKLTLVLRDSFICENTKTCMIAMVSPGMSSCEHSLNTLRYADRVKELAATDLLQEGSNDEHRDGHDDDLNHDDLAALRSLNEGELSGDLYDFHEAVSQLQQREEEMLDSLKVWRETNTKLGTREDYLLSLTRNVDYDQDTFASQIDEVIKERLRCLQNLQEKVTAFKHQLVTEEEISRKMTPKVNLPN
ncbi:kinesin-like protein 10A isoform X2 [Rhodnius prolixus]|uniref:kinesin-like protein 10A isoform X2 n=1 Tax=Rhodnius prolixus TaxID=13249 RepID=UPI003D18CA23